VRARPGMRRRAAIARWALRNPRLAVRHREWVLQEIGLERLAGLAPVRGGRLRRTPPYFLERHARPLIDPPTVPASDAAHMRDDDIVLGLALRGEARAYPWWIMDNHHLANDAVGGQPIIVLLCEMCSTGMAFDPRVDGRRLTFEQRHVFNGTITMDDRETGSVWSPYYAEAIRGRLKGTRLPLLPLQQTSWRAWRERHPETTVLGPGLGSRTGHGSDHHIGGPNVADGMRATMARWDSRLPHNTLVLGVITEGGQRAYPLDLLRERDGVAVDEIGGVPVVILADVGNGRYGALAFDRRVGGRVLSFERRPDGPTDRETGTRWSLEGRGEEGALAGTQLRFLPSHVSEWYVWASHYPELEIAGR
jgi:hypothetical protein